MLGQQRLFMAESDPKTSNDSSWRFWDRIGAAILGGERGDLNRGEAQ
jgi:hypothetical protein